MTELIEACRKVLNKKPNKYIHCVNEFDNVYQFVMLDNGVDIKDVSFVCNTPMIDKRSGKLMGGTMLDALKMGDYIQHTREEIESLLSSRKAS